MEKGTIARGIIMGQGRILRDVIGEGGWVQDEKVGGEHRSIGHYLKFVILLGSNVYDNHTSMRHGNPAISRATSSNEFTNGPSPSSQ